MVRGPMLASGVGSGILTPAVWKEVDPWGILAGRVPGYFNKDNLTEVNATRWDEQEADVGVTVSLINNLAGSPFYRIDLGTTQNEEGSIAWDSADGTEYQGVYFDSGRGSWAFEVGIRLSSIDDASVLIAMAEEGLSAANTLTDTTGAPADKDYIGFRVKADDVDGLDAVYNTASGGGESVHANPAINLVADTWYQLGVSYNDLTKKLLWFVDGAVVNPTGVLESAANVPDGNELYPLIAAKLAAGTTTCLVDIRQPAYGVRFLT